MMDKYQGEKKKREAPVAKVTIGFLQEGTDQESGQPKRRRAQASLSLLAESLDEFGVEIDRTLAKMEAPSLSYFRELIQKAKPQIKRRKAIETLSFLVMALSYLFLIGYSIDAGYLLPVVIFFSVAWMFLPTVLLFSGDFRKERGSEE